MRTTNKPIIRVNWIGLPKAYYVRRITRTGYVSGHLTDREGWGGCHLAQPFDSIELAERAAEQTGVRFWEILDNTEAALPVKFFEVEYEAGSGMLHVFNIKAHSEAKAIAYLQSMAPRADAIDIKRVSEVCQDMRVFADAT